MRNKLGIWFLGCNLFFNPFHAVSQCCGPGNPVAGNINAGVIPKKNIRVIGFYRHSVSDKYLKGNSPSDFNYLKKAVFDYSGLIAAYGVNSKLTLEAELGYFIRKTQVVNSSPSISLTGRGFNNSALNVKYLMVKSKKAQFEMVPGIGFKFPFSQEYKRDKDVVLPIDIQPSTMATGWITHLFLYKGYLQKGLRFFLIYRGDFNGENERGYKFGNSFSSSFFVAKKMSPRFTGLLQIRNDYRKKDQRNGKDVNASGANLLFLSPQIIFIPNPKWSVSVLTDIPLYRYYNGTQIAQTKMISVNLVRSFCL